MIIAAVQVRMSSTRLPGKVLAAIEGRPMLWHIVNRLHCARHVDQVVIATSSEPADAPIRSFAETHDIPCFAGSELDLVDRLYSTARHFAADALVRITGDCPLVDPVLVDKLVEAFLDQPDPVDYVTNTFPPSFPDGLDAEVFPTSTLERLMREIEDPFSRDWFVVYLETHQESFISVNLAHHEDLSALRWTVDYQEDLEFVSGIYARLYQQSRVFGMEEVLEVVRMNPELAAINAKYSRNEAYAIARKARSLDDKD